MFYRTYALPSVGPFSTGVGNANAGWSATPLPLIACPVLDTGVSASNQVCFSLPAACPYAHERRSGTHHVR